MDRRKTILKRVLLVFSILVLAVGVGTTAFLFRILHPRSGEHTGAGPMSIGQTFRDISDLVGNPYAGFPKENRVVILCMGIDDNWTDSDEVYTAGARTDTLFFLTLDLKNRKATMLSIPRDTYAHIAGTNTTTKINAAYGSGGPMRAVATVAEMTGIQADHYMVLNIDATKKMVDALGGVDVDVEHEMHYHDKWGHLSIDLMPGFQHLAGDQAVGFARYRHGDAGAKPSPEDGDERRMERQHVLMRAMVAKAKSFANYVQAPHLIDIGMSTIRTDLSRAQLLDLAAIYRGIQTSDITTASLPGEDFHGPHGGWDYRLYPNAMAAYVDWLVRGDETAARRLTPVVIANGTAIPGLAAHAADVLRKLGYDDIRIESGGRSRVHLAVDTGTPANSATQYFDTGVPDANITSDVSAALGLNDALGVRNPNKPNRLGWTAPAKLTILLGQDYAQAVASSGTPVTADESNAVAAPDQTATPDNSAGAATPANGAAALSGAPATTAPTSSPTAQ